MVTIPDFDSLGRLIEYMQEVPQDVTPNLLYTASSLYGEAMNKVPPKNAFRDCYDQKVYRHFLKNGKHSCGEKEMLTRALHDYGIDRALEKFLAKYDRRLVVGVMGGHSLLRTDCMYREIVLLSKALTEKRSLMVTGGGPGAMEATHLGAWLAGRTTEEVDEALGILAASPSFKDGNWLETAFQVIRQFPQKEYHSLGIPTWLYGHEPSTPFATDIAKYFDNSIREDTILTIAFGGIIYTPGSAGTIQEVFQEAVQNHYLSFDISSPMIFLGRKFWDEDIPVYPFLEKMMQEGKYKNLRLTLTDSSETAVREILCFRGEENIPGQDDVK